MDEVANVVTGAVLVMLGFFGLIILGVILGAAMGAFAATIVAVFFPKTMAIGLALTPFTQPYQLGAALGFVGGFFRASQTNNNKG